MVIDSSFESPAHADFPFALRFPLSESLREQEAAKVGGWSKLETVIPLDSSAQHAAPTAPVAQSVKCCTRRV